LMPSAYQSHPSQTATAQTVLFKSDVPPKLLEKYRLTDTSQSSLAKGLRNAAYRNDVEDLKFFIGRVTDINACDDREYKRNALHWAVIRSHTECVKLLLEAGVDLSIKDVNHKTVFAYADRETLN